MSIFYHPNVSKETIILSSQESFHCVKVLRCGIGELVQLVDGMGGFYQARIENTDQKGCLLRILDGQQNYQKPEYELHIGIAPTKSIDRFEWFLEKATEIGVTSITPLICEHSERRHLRLDRLEKVIVSALKQSGKAYKPVLSELRTISDWMEDIPDGEKYIAYCSGRDRMEMQDIRRTSINTVLIGPEGDFSPEEIDMAVERGFQTISLGNSIMRTETAGVFICSAFNLCSK